MDRYNNTYSVTQWETPDGFLGSEYYGEAPPERGTGRPRWWVQVPEEEIKLGKVVGDPIRATADEAEIKGKTLVQMKGDRIIDEFRDDAGTIFRQEGTEAKQIAMRNSKDEPLPTKRQMVIGASK